MKAYEDVIRNTATEQAPWYIVPADNKWFARLVDRRRVIYTRCATWTSQYPKVDEAKRQELAAARAVARAVDVAARPDGEGPHGREAGQGQEVEEGQEVQEGQEVACGLPPTVFSLLPLHALELPLGLEGSRKQYPQAVGGSRKT